MEQMQVWSWVYQFLKWYDWFSSIIGK